MPSPLATANDRTEARTTIDIVGAKASPACPVRKGCTPRDIRFIVFDERRGVGGRMATRHVATALGAVTFDRSARSSCVSIQRDSSRCGTATDARS